MSSVWLSPDLRTLRSGPIAAPLAAAAASAAAPSERFVLRRSGARPLTFTGMLLLEHTARDRDAHERRHAIRVYETSGGRMIVAIELSLPSGEGIAHGVVAELETLQQAADFLDAYDPAGQAALALSVDDRDADAFSIGRMAESLRADAERLRNDFQQARDAIFAAARHDEHDTSRRVN
ncbi:MAG: hypothetical protein ACRCTI_02540 [Beijerinckiaceae bacterium]